MTWTPRTTYWRIQGSRECLTKGLSVNNLVNSILVQLEQRSSSPHIDIEIHEKWSDKTRLRKLIAGRERRESEINASFPCPSPLPLRTSLFCSPAFPWPSEQSSSMPSLGGLLKKRRTKDSKDSQDLSSELPASDHISSTDDQHDASMQSTATSQASPQQQPQQYGHAQSDNAASINNIVNAPANAGGEQQNAEQQQVGGQQQSQAQAQPAQKERTTRGKYSQEDFTLQRTLGTGSFGRVHLVQSKHNHRFYAMKVLKKAQVVKMKQIEHTNDERRMLNRVRHPFLVTLWGTWQDSRNLYMVMDFVEGGELFSLLRKSQVGFWSQIISIDLANFLFFQRFPNPVAKFYAAEVTLALEYLHAHQIIYRDLKPENLLLDRHGHLKITDFGFAKEVPDITWTLCGTPDYLAPEVVSSKGYNKSVDWYVPLGLSCELGLTVAGGHWESSFLKCFAASHPSGTAGLPSKSTRTSYGARSSTRRICTMMPWTCCLSSSLPTLPSGWATCTVGRKTSRTMHGSLKSLGTAWRAKTLTRHIFRRFAAAKATQANMTSTLKRRNIMAWRAKIRTLGPSVWSLLTPG